MAEQRTNIWLAAWRQAALDRLPRNRKDAPWLWILAAQAEAHPSLARRMAIVEVLGDGRPHPGPDLRTAVEDRLGIESILRVSGPKLDLAYVDREAARIGVFGTWRELLERSGPD